MCNALGAPITYEKYYHYQYPDATKCMLIVETLVGAGEDSFNLKIPLAFTVYERSYSHYAQGASGYPSYFKLDLTTISTITTNGQTKYGTLTATQLSPNVFHTASIAGQYGGSYLYGICIALIYKEG